MARQGAQLSGPRMRPYRSMHETGRLRDFCRLLYGMSFSLAAEQFQRKSKRRAWLAIDVRCFARVVWEIGLQDAGAGGPHDLFLHPWLARASSYHYAGKWEMGRKYN